MWCECEKVKKENRLIVGKKGRKKESKMNVEEKRKKGMCEKNMHSVKKVTRKETQDKTG